MLLITIILSLCSATAETLRLTEEVFYKADTLLYTPEFCSALQASDFLHSIRPLAPAESSTATAATELKTRAFKTLFDACRGRLLFDGIMAKNVIVPMLDTGNTEYLALLLDQGIKNPEDDPPKDPKEKKRSDKQQQQHPPVFNNLDLSSEIKSLTLHLFGVNISPSPSTNHFFFQVRNPDRALAYLFAYTHLEREAVEEVRELLENVSNHVAVGEFADARSITRAIKLIDGYLSAPKTIGNHKVKLSVLRKDEVIESDSLVSTLASTVLKVLGLILGFGTVATIVFVLWKNQQSKVAYHRST